jgi:hypothetical protein
MSRELGPAIVIVLGVLALVLLAFGLYRLTVTW